MIDPDKIPSLNRTVAQINKTYGENTIGYLGKMKNLDIERISSGIKILDDAVGGGMPLGRMVELYGVPSSGKSLISLKTIVEAQKQGLDCIYIDAENAFDPIFAQMIGVDTTKLIVTQVAEGEDLFEIVFQLLKSQPGIIVVDSVAAIVTLKEMNEPMEQAVMAPKARLMSRGLPKLNALNKKTLVIFINQLRSTLAMYGKPTTTTGGRALGYYATLRIEVKQGEKLTANGKKYSEDNPAVGQVVQFRVDKNKAGAPFKQGSFSFYYDGRFE